MIDPAKTKNIKVFTIAFPFYLFSLLVSSYV